MEKTKLIKVTNRDSGKVGYEVPELNVMRQFMPRETKEVPFEELERLSWLMGGEDLLRNYLIVQDEEAIKLLLNEVEPEYHYTENDIKNLMLLGTLDEFLDCLDFAPTGALEIIKMLAVELPLNDVAKREAIYDKLGFNVTNAIEIKNFKYDGEIEAEEDAEKADKPARRVAATAETKSNRRAAAPSYKVTSTNK